METLGGRRNIDRVRWGSRSPNGERRRNLEMLTISPPVSTHSPDDATFDTAIDKLLYRLIGKFQTAEEDFEAWKVGPCGIWGSTSDPIVDADLCCRPN